MAPRVDTTKAPPNGRHKPTVEEKNRDKMPDPPIKKPDQDTMAGKGPVAGKRRAV